MATGSGADGVGIDRSAGFGRWLGLWAALVVGLQLVAWGSGYRGAGLAAAVEQGSARVETKALGEVGDEVIRKAIQTQRDTLPFWAILLALGDFGAEPLGVAVRALLCATVFAGLAALAGRPTRIGETLADCARGQWPWVLGLAVQVGLMLLLRRPDVETSATLLLPDGTYPATFWTALKQLDAFALIGWTGLALGAHRRGQLPLWVALGLCLLLWTIEASMRVGLALAIGAGMRLTVLPA